MANLLFKQEVTEIKEQSVNIEEGIYYSAKIYNSNDKIYAISRYFVEKDGVTHYMRCYENRYEVIKTNVDNRDRYLKWLMEDLGLIKDKYSEFICHSKLIDCDTFTKYHNYFLNLLIPKFL